MRSVIVATALAVVLAGCGGSGDTSDVKPLDAATSSATPTPQADGTRPKDVKSEKGAIAFSDFVVRSIVDTTGGGDIEDFLALATPTCTGCVTLAKQRGEDPEEIQKMDSPPTITDASLVKRDGDDFVVQQTVAMSAGQIIDTSDDSVTSTFDPMTYRFVIRSTWKTDRWVISDYSVEKIS